jgi:hypothetical protein
LEHGVGLQGAGGFSPDVPTFPNGCHICEVEIDPDTGEAALDRCTFVDDIGTVINLLLARVRSTAASRKAPAKHVTRTSPTTPRPARC